MFLKAPCTLLMWAAPGGVWAPSTVGCRPPGPAGSRRACWSLPVVPGAESILERRTHRESCEAGLSLALFGEEEGRAAGSVLARQPRAQPPGGALCPMSPDSCSAPRCSSGFSSSPLFPWPHRGHRQGAGGHEQTLSRAGKRAGWRSSSSSCVSLGGRAGRQLGMSLACDREAGSCLLISGGPAGSLLLPSLFLEQTFPGRSRSYSDVCSGCWLRAAKT